MYGNQRKKIEIAIKEEGSKEDVSVEEIKEAASQLFNIEMSQIQARLWDKGFDDWIDADDNDAVENNSRVCILLAATVTSNTDDNTTPCVSPALSG